MRNKEKNWSKHINLKATTNPHKTGKDWLMVQLGDVCEVNPKKSEIKDKSLKASFVPMAELNENNMDFNPKETRIIKEIFNSYTYFKDNDVLLAKITPCFENGKAGIAKNLKNKIGFGSTEFTVLRSNNGILPQFIYYQISNDVFRKEGVNHMTGTSGHKRVPVSFVAKYKIPLAPLPEQKEIVQKIENIFKLIDLSEKELKSAKEKLKVYRQAILKKAFEGKLLSKKELDICKQKKDWKSVSKLLKDINLNASTSPHKTRKDWLMVQLGDVAKVVSGQSPKSKYYNDDEKGLPFYQGKKEFKEIYLGCPVKWTTNITKVAITNDILISVRAPVGPVNITKQKICIGRGLSAIRVKKINQMFMFYFLRGNQNKITGGSGSVFNSIDQKSIKEIQIPLVLLPEQKAIVQKIENIFSYCDKLSSEIEQNLENIKLLRQSVLKKAFSGTFLNKRELEKCKKSLDWKSAKGLLEEIQKEHRKIEKII